MIDASVIDAPVRLAVGVALMLTIVSCGAGAPTYAGCSDDLDCVEGADRCHRLIFDRTDGTTADGNLCTHECFSDAECGADGVCIALDGDPTMRFFCAQRCSVAADCYADFACTPIAAMDASLCLP